MVHPDRVHAIVRRVSRGRAGNSVRVTRRLGGHLAQVDGRDQYTTVSRIECSRWPGFPRACALIDDAGKCHWPDWFLPGPSLGQYVLVARVVSSYMMDFRQVVDGDEFSHPVDLEIVPVPLASHYEVWTSRGDHSYLVKYMRRDHVENAMVMLDARLRDRKVQKHPRWTRHLGRWIRRLNKELSRRVG